MATIRAGTSEKTYTIAKFKGLNECADGENNLEINEASRMVNCKVTKERNLTKRPGTRTWIDLGNSPVMGLWHGVVNGREVTLCASGNHLYKLDFSHKDKTDLGRLDTTNRVSFFPFQNIVYILNGKEYKSYDGAALKEVEGYRPLILISTPPEGGGSTEGAEEINKLTGKVRQWFSPDGTANTFVLSADGVEVIAVDYVLDLTTNEYISDNAYTINLANRTVTFDASETFRATATRYSFKLSNNVSAVTTVTINGIEALSSAYTFDNTTKILTLTPAPSSACTVVVTETITPLDRGTNTLEIGYTIANDERPKVCRMTNAELFSGGTDAIVCIYGDGTNEFLYSSVDYYGVPRADYFPDLNEASVGSSNTEITQLIRHQSRMIAFKPDDAYSITFSSVTTDENNYKYAYCITPINREKGNEAKGMVQLVDNAPRTLWKHDCYYWVNSSYYSSNLTADERQARLASQKVHDTLSGFDFATAYTFDDNSEKEYWIISEDKALVQNYETEKGAWYYYEGFNINCMLRVDNELWAGTKNGKIQRVSNQYADDDGTAFNVEYESGAIDFGRPDMFKFTNKVYVSIKPQGRGKVKIALSTDKKIATAKKDVTSNILDFADISFGSEEGTEATESNSFTFETNDMPHTKRLKIKAKKFTYWKVLISLESKDESFTLTNISVPVRFTGMAK